MSDRFSNQSQFIMYLLSEPLLESEGTLEHLACLHFLPVSAIKH